MRMKNPSVSNNIMNNRQPRSLPHYHQMQHLNHQPLNNHNNIQTYNNNPDFKMNLIPSQQPQPERKPITKKYTFRDQKQFQPTFATQYMQEHVQPASIKPPQSNQPQTIGEKSGFRPNSQFRPPSNFSSSQEGAQVHYNQGIREGKDLPRFVPTAPTTSIPSMSTNIQGRADSSLDGGGLMQAQNKE